MTAPDFALRLSRQPDEELVRIAYSGPEDGFLPEAIEAARAELERRNLPEEDIEETRGAMDGERLAEANRPTAPLGWPGRVYFLIFGPILMVSIAVAFAIHMRGYKRKSWDAVKFTMLSFLLWAGLTIVLDLVIG